MAATYIIVTNSEVETIVSRYFSTTPNGKSKNTVHVHCALQSLMTFAGAAGVFIDSAMPAFPIQIQGDRLRLKTLSVVKSNLIAIEHTASGEVAYFNYPDTLFYNAETLIVGIGNKVITPTTVVADFITQNNFVIPMLNHATIKETALTVDVPEEYDLNNNNSFMNIWLRNESGAGVNDIQNLVGIAISFLGLIGYTLNAIAIKYGVFATFEVE